MCAAVGHYQTVAKDAAVDASGTAEQALADMIHQDLGVAVDPERLRRFIRSRWSRVQRLAHRVHET